MPFRQLATNIRTSHELVYRLERPSCSVFEDRFIRLPRWPKLGRRYLSTPDAASPPRVTHRSKAIHPIAVRRLNGATERDGLGDGLSQVRLENLISQGDTDPFDAAGVGQDEIVDYYNELSIQEEEDQKVTDTEVVPSGIETITETDGQSCRTKPPADIDRLREILYKVLGSPGTLKVWHTESPEARIQAYFDRIFRLSDGTSDVMAYQKPDEKLAVSRQYFTKEIELFEAFSDYTTSHSFGLCWRPNTYIHTTDDAWLVSVLVGAILRSPKHTLHSLSILGGTMDSFAVRADCLYAIEQLYKNQINSDPELLTSFNEMTRDLYDPVRWPARMALRHLRLLLQRAEAQDRAEMVQAWRAKYEDLDPDTGWGRNSRRIMAHLCIAVGFHDAAVDILETLPQRCLSSPTTATMKLCARALEQDPVVSNGEGVNFKRLPRLLQAGFQPDALLYGRIAYNALIAGYPGVAWDLYIHAKNNDAEPEPLMYVAILKFAFVDRDMKKVDELLSNIHQEPALYTHPYIVAFTMHMVRVISYMRGTLASEEIFAPMFAIYDRGYKRDVLVRLGIVGESLTVDHEGRRQEPPSGLVAHVVRSCLLAGRVVSHGLIIWRSLMNAQAEGDAAVTAALSEIVLYDGFILFWSRQASTLPRALETMRHLLNSRMCAPTAHTWSLLICGYLKHEQAAEARLLVKLMEKHGMTTAELAQDTMNGTKLSDEIKSRMDELLSEDAPPEYPEALTLLENKVFEPLDGEEVPLFGEDAEE